jgi:signal transduction histidine kinase
VAHVRVWLVLGVLAAAVLGVGTLDLVQHYQVGTAAAVGLSALRAAPLGVVRFRPRLAWVGTLAAVLLTAALAHPVDGSEPWPWAVTSVLAALPVLVVLGARLEPPAARPLWTAAPVRALAGLRLLHPAPALVWLTVPASGALALLVAPDRGGSWSALIPVCVLAAAALVGGRLARDRVEDRRRLDEQVVATDTERAGRAELAERARLARELHDVIAHGLSEVTVRADSAPHRVPDVSPAAAAEFDAIAEAARGALAELRQVLGVLRDPGADPQTAPLPGLAELPALVGDTPLTVSARPERVPPVVQLTAYRVVQEALSNVRRHAPGATASVSVAEDTGGLRVLVSNPAAAGPGIGTGRGYGLAGMRERVALLRGTLAAGPGPGGGWRVEAVLPLTQEDG